MSHDFFARCHDGYYGDEGTCSFSNDDVTTLCKIAALLENMCCETPVIDKITADIPMLVTLYSKDNPDTVVARFRKLTITMYGAAACRLSLPNDVVLYSTLDKHNGVWQIH